MKSKPINPFAALAAELSRKVTKPARADGWRTSAELRVEFGCSEDRCHGLIKAAIAADRMERWTGYIFSEEKKIRVRHVAYRLKKSSTPGKKKLATCRA